VSSNLLANVIVSLQRDNAAIPRLVKGRHALRGKGQRFIPVEVEEVPPAAQRGGALFKSLRLFFDVSALESEEHKVRSLWVFHAVWMTILAILPMSGP
jgi:hypothetical protein